MTYEQALKHVEDIAIEQYKMRSDIVRSSSFPATRAAAKEAWLALSIAMVARDNALGLHDYSSVDY